MPPKNRTWFTCKVDAEGDAEISIYDEIGMWGITAKDFRDELRALGDVDHINVSINSPGGSVFDGIAIHNMLSRHKATVTVWIDGIAASIASVIAMAGNAIMMPSNSMLMIHDPSGVVMGTSRDMRELADALDKIKSSIIRAYQKKSDLSDEEISDLMSEETWLTAEEAHKLGFIDSIEEPIKVAAKFSPDRFKSIPDFAAAMFNPEKERDMDNENQTGTEVEAETEVAAAPEAAAEEVVAEVAAAPEAAAEVVDEAAVDATAEAPAEQKPQAAPDYAREVRDLCKLAGASPEATLAFIINATPIEEVRKQLLKTKEGDETINHHSASIKATSGVKPAIDATAIYARRNAVKA